MTLNGFLHPALAFIALAVALPFFPGQTVEMASAGSARNCHYCCFHSYSG